jgi:hypothetical protein
VAHRLTLAVTVGLLVLARAGTSRAGCPNLCTLAHEPVVVAPALDCLAVQVSEDDCDCGLHLAFHNGCHGDLAANGFVFATCGHYGGNSAALRDGCSALKAGEDGVLLLRAAGSEGAGRKVRELHLQGPDGEPVVTAAFTVTSFRSGGFACGSIAGGGHPSAPLVGLTAWLILRRRARRGIGRE